MTPLGSISVPSGDSLEYGIGEMCEPKHYIQLCTCGQVSKNETNIWKLERQIDRTQDLVGLVICPEEPLVIEHYLREHLTNDLNAGIVFDHPHQFQERDVLTIVLDDFEFVFTYLDSKFTWEDYPWLGPSEIIKKGRVKINKQF